MSEDKFAPMLAPNEEIKPEQLTYPLLASYKLDGIRCIVKSGDLFTRHLKAFPNKQLRKKFEELAYFTKATPQAEKRVLDGEFLAKSMTFSELSGTVRALDREIPSDLYFYIFDSVEDENFDEPFIVRIQRASKIAEAFPDLVRHVKHVLVRNPDEVKHYFKEAVAWGCDGLILRNGNGRYKMGRGTLKEGLIYKLKPYTTFDAQIIGVVQGTVVNPNAPKKINELGHSETSKKKGDRILVNKACDFEVLHQGKILKVMIAMTDTEKEEVWLHKEKYIGRWIEYKGLTVGMVDLPRHPVFLRFRDDKE